MCKQPSLTTAKKTKLSALARGLLSLFVFFIHFQPNFRSDLKNVSPLREMLSFLSIGLDMLKSQSVRGCCLWCLIVVVFMLFTLRRALIFRLGFYFVQLSIFCGLSHLICMFNYGCYCCLCKLFSPSCDKLLLLLA